jgi:WD40 repeat protein
VQVLQGPTKGVRSIAFSPDVGRLAAGGYDGSLRVWDLGGGTCTRLRGSGVTPRSLAWSADGGKVFWTGGSGNMGNVCWTAAAGESQVVIQADVGRDDGGLGFTVTGHEGAAQVFWAHTAREVGGLCVAPDGRTLYAATRDAVRRWNLPAGGVELPPWPAVSPGHLAISADGRTLASAHPLSSLARVDPFHVGLWDVAAGRLTGRLLGPRESFDGLAFSPDGTRLAAVSHQALWLWELPSGCVLAEHPSRKFYTGVAYAPDGRLVATSGNDGAVRLWDGRTGVPRGAFEWELGKALCVAFAPDGQRAAAGGTTGKVAVWDVD